MTRPIKLGTFPIQLKYSAGDYDVYVSRYISTGDLAIFLAPVDVEEIELNVTVNLEDYGIRTPIGHVYVKDHDQNQGVLASLINADVLTPQVHAFKNHYGVIWPCCEVLMKEKWEGKL
jgi:hypothetical protein